MSPAKVVMSVGECTMAVPGEEMDGTGELTRACLMLLQQIFTLDCDNLIWKLNSSYPITKQIIFYFLDKLLK